MHPLAKSEFVAILDRASFGKRRIGVLQILYRRDKRNKEGANRDRAQIRLLPERQDHTKEKTSKSARSNSGISRARISGHTQIEVIKSQ